MNFKTKELEFMRTIFLNVFANGLLTPWEEVDYLLTLHQFPKFLRKNVYEIFDIITE